MNLTAVRFSSFLLGLVFLLILAHNSAAERLFSDTFENNLDRWQISSDPDVIIRPSGDSSHRNVLVLIPNGDVYALIRGSDRWSGISMQGDVLFPRQESNYLGVIYNFQTHQGRTDFGNVYIKGDGSYLQVNPHWDFNVGRTLYPEYHIDLNGPAAIQIGQWQHFKVEVIGNECHFYIGDMTTPQLTFALSSMKPGGYFGLQPRSVGGEVWVDNITVDAIDTFTYQGPHRPAVSYEKERLLTNWEVLGPLERSNDDVARNNADVARSNGDVARKSDSSRHSWRPFATDERGAVVTGLITDYQGPRTVAYFRTQFQHNKNEERFLHISTVDDLAMWINGRFWWFIGRSEFAWFDFWKNPDHKGQRIPVPLKKGINEIVLRARGGVYASGGFYLALETAD